MWMQYFLTKKNVNVKIIINTQYFLIKKYHFVYYQKKNFCINFFFKRLFFILKKIFKFLNQVTFICLYNILLVSYSYQELNFKYIYL